MTLTYFVSPAPESGKGFYKVSYLKNNQGGRVEELTINSLPDAIGRATIMMLQSHHDHGHRATLVIEVEVCNIDDPTVHC